MALVPQVSPPNAFVFASGGSVAAKALCGEREPTARLGYVHDTKAYGQIRQDQRLSRYLKVSALFASLATTFSLEVRWNRTTRIPFWAFPLFVSSRFPPTTRPPPVTTATRTGTRERGQTQSSNDEAGGDSVEEDLLDTFGQEFDIRNKCQEIFESVTALSVKSDLIIIQCLPFSNEKIRHSAACR
ncbi:hypothetical protein BDR04DRAFT_1228548 [Suillus decipiens]|nr:hypothetical protein BDR04DRAFT_1228548 [Suillus decipiens]